MATRATLVVTGWVSVVAGLDVLNFGMQNCFMVEQVGMPTGHSPCASALGAQQLAACMPVGLYAESHVAPSQWQQEVPAPTLPLM